MNPWKQETLDPLFLTCSYVRAAWFGCPLSFQTYRVQEQHIIPCLEDWIQSIHWKSEKNRFIYTAQVVVLWGIWKNQNAATIIQETKRNLIVTWRILEGDSKLPCRPS